MIFFWRKKNKSPEVVEPDVVESEVVDPDAVAPEAAVAESPQSKQQKPQQESKKEVLKKTATKPKAPPESSTEAPPEIPPEIRTEAPPETIEQEESSTGWMKRLRKGLSKTTQGITTGVSQVLGKSALDDSDIDAITDVLIMADVGVDVATRLATGMKKRAFPDGVNGDTLADALAAEIATILKPVEKPLGIDEANRPHVILMVGVNGSGKTTTAGKLAEFFKANGKSVMLAAADTFRAAAVEQLQIWGERTATPVITGEEGADAAAVAFKALEQAAATGIEVVIVDTAGRLQSRKELMDELAKIYRVLGKQDATAPHDSIIVLDGTVGQNAFSQVGVFNEVAALTGMIITKLDGTARGGVVVALAQEYALPIHAIGVGEQKEDLQPFEADAFASALAGSYKGGAADALDA